MAESRTVAYVRLQSKTTGKPLVHPDLRKRLIAEATESGMSLNDTAVMILADAYQVPYETTSNTATLADVDGEELNLRIPDALYAAIGAHTARPRTIQDAIRAALSAHFGLFLPA